MGKKYNVMTVALRLSIAEMGGRLAETKGKFTDNIADIDRWRSGFQIPYKSRSRKIGAHVCLDSGEGVHTESTVGPTLVDPCPRPVARLRPGARVHEPGPTVDSIWTTLEIA